MVFIKNPLIPKKSDSHVKFENPPGQSKGILDDFAVRKVVSTREGTITKTPVNANDIVNKAYTDSLSLWEIDGTETQLITADEIDMRSKKIINALDPTNDQEVATKKYVDDAIAAGGGSVTLTRTAFDITANTEIVAAAGAGIKICVAAISMHNNDATSTNDTHVKITDGNAGAVLIGGATGNIYLVGRGGFFGLPMSTTYPWCKTTANTALYINPTDGMRIAGAVWTFEE